MALSPQIVQAIARDGVKGDTLLGHLTRGDTVIPSQAPPAVHDIARQSMAAHGMDVNRFVAGAPGNHINPKTGLHSFEDGGGGGEGGGGEGGGGGGEGGEGGEGGGGSGPSGGGDKSGGDVGSGGGAQGGSPDTGGNSGSGTGNQGGNSVGGGSGGMGVGGGDASGGANSGNNAGVSGADGAPSGAPGNDGMDASGVDTSAPGPTGLTASQALLGVDFSDLGPAGKLAMGVVPGMATLSAVNGLTAHGVDQPSNPGGNLSASATGGVGLGQGADTDAGQGGGHSGSEHPDTVQNVLNNQTVGGSNGGTAAPDAPANKQQNPVTPTDPFTDLKAALAAAHGIDKSPTFTSGSDAEILNAILGPQRAAAEQQLQNAHMRGTLSDQGYNSAELGLGTQDQQANSRIGNISDNLLAAYQQKLDAYANQAITSAGGTTQGNPWDVTPWQSGYNSLLSTLQGREQGDLLNLLPSGGSLYDIPTLLANAGNSQGLYNPGGSPIQQALSDQRGLGTTGVF